MRVTPALGTTHSNKIVTKLDSRRVLAIRYLRGSMSIAETENGKGREGAIIAG